MKYNKIFLLSVTMLIMLPLSIFPSETKTNSNATPDYIQRQLSMPKDELTRKIILQNQLEKIGIRLLKEKKYDEAITYFEKSVEMDKELYGSELGSGYGLIAEAYEKQGQYERALERVSNLYKDRPQHFSLIDWKLKLEAIIKAKKEGTNKPIYDYINYYKGKYKEDLPPRNYWSLSIICASQLIQLYDFMGDAKGGISFVDQILAYPKLPKKERGEYLKIRQAFEEDNAHGTTGGATEVIIHSDYLPYV